LVGYRREDGKGVPEVATLFQRGKLARANFAGRRMLRDGRVSPQASRGRRVANAGASFSAHVDPAGGFSSTTEQRRISGPDELALEFGSAPGSRFAVLRGFQTLRDVTGDPRAIVRGKRTSILVGGRRGLPRSS
jgi:hypothetical protein